MKNVCKISCVFLSLLTAVIFISCSHKTEQYDSVITYAQAADIFVDGKETEKYKRFENKKADSVKKGDFYGQLFDVEYDNSLKSDDGVIINIYSKKGSDSSVYVWFADDKVVYFNNHRYIETEEGEIKTEEELLEIAKSIASDYNFDLSQCEESVSTDKYEGDTSFKITLKQKFCGYPLERKIELQLLKTGQLITFKLGGYLELDKFEKLLTSDIKIDNEKVDESIKRKIEAACEKNGHTLLNYTVSKQYIGFIGNEVFLFSTLNLVIDTEDYLFGWCNVKTKLGEIS